MAASGPAESKENQEKIERFKKTLELAEKNLDQLAEKQAEAQEQLPKEKRLTKEELGGIRTKIDGEDYLLVRNDELKALFKYATDPKLGPRLAELQPGKALRIKTIGKPEKGEKRKVGEGSPPRTFHVFCDYEGNLRLIIDTKRKYVKNGFIVKFAKGVVEKGGGFKKGKPMRWIDSEGNIKEGFNLVMKPENMEQIEQAKEEARISQELPNDIAVHIVGGTSYDSDGSQLKANQDADRKAEYAEAMKDEAAADAPSSDAFDLDAMDIPGDEFSFDESGDGDNISFPDEPLQEKPEPVPAEKPQENYNVFSFEKAESDLHDYLIQNKLNTSQKEQIIWQILKSIDALKVEKDKHYIHQDIKPQNFLVFKDPDGIRIKITDFGTTQKKGDKWENGRPPSTPAIISPEMFKYMKNALATQPQLRLLMKLPLKSAFSDQLALKVPEGDAFKPEASESNDMWALGLTILQILHPELNMQDIYATRTEGGMSDEEAEEIRVKCIARVTDHINKLDAEKDRLLYGLLRSTPRIDIDQAIKIQHGIMNQARAPEAEVKQRVAEAEISASPAPAKVDSDPEVKLRAADAASGPSPHSPKSRPDPPPPSPRPASPPPSPKGAFIRPIVAKYEELAKRQQREMEESATKRQKATEQESPRPGSPKEGSPKEDDKRNKPKGNF